MCDAFENMTNIINELQRRSVFRVAAVYLALAWLTLQILDTVKGLLRCPLYAPKQAFTCPPADLY